MDRVIIFDTMLRDGEQSPGFSMNTMEKLEMARQLARLNVDVIEAGFPISSEEDFEATREVARQVGRWRARPPFADCPGSGLADIDRCWKPVSTRAAADPHLRGDLRHPPQVQARKSRAEVLEGAWRRAHARGYCEDVEFSPEDASRSDFD